jgi:hypothetical protein
MNKLQKSFRKNEKMIGAIASTLAVVMFFSLLEVFFSNLRGNSNIFIQPLATAFNGLFWTMYAYGRKDWFLVVPNFLAMILGTVTTVSAFV